MIKLKRGVKLRGMRPEMVLAIMVAEGVYAELGYPLLTITSGGEGRHSRGSLHYAGLAVDFRTRHMERGDRRAAADMLRENLGAEFDVVLEASHLHCEFQPKGS